jgi:hypothetical protein
VKINALAVLKTLDGDDLKFPPVNGHEALPITLRRACVEALMVPREGESGEEKFKKFAIATKIHKEDTVDLSPEEITVVKASIGHWGGPLIVGQAFQLLNG